METKTLTAEDLAQYKAQTSGTDHHYKHIFVRGFVYTDGVKFVAERAGAYWLIDEIAFLQVRKLRSKPTRIADEEFQVWKLIVKDSSAKLVLEDGNDNVLFTKKIEFTDFPLDSIEFWFENHTLYLPEER